MTLAPISPKEAAQALSGLGHLDPSGRCTEGGLRAMCEASRCVQVTDGHGGLAVVVYELDEGGTAWVCAAVGQGGRDLTAAIDDAMRSLGARAVAFQTKRRGLVRRAERLGYALTGYIMRRDL